MFTLLQSNTYGRLGQLTTVHGTIPTPFFLPVATAGAMKGITFDDLHRLGAEVLLCNTYHLHIQPGEDVIAAAGGLHQFIDWQKPILTDSGGYQVFSLKAIRNITDDGVTFRNHRNGDELFIGPRESIMIQHKLGSDIMMCFDECPPSTAPRAEIIKAVDRTLRWAMVCKREHERLKAERAGKKEKKGRLENLPHLSALSHFPHLFGIVQGGLERDLRKKCAEELIAIGFDGYAVGGLAVGESEEEMYQVLDDVCPILPVDKLRYLMGVGGIKQHKECVARGIDMFDCVMQMREARHGNIWLSDGSVIRIKRSEFKDAHVAIDQKSPSVLSQRHYRSYLHHLMKLGERYGETIACLQNMGVTLEGMRRLRREIQGNCYIAILLYCCKQLL